MSTQEKKTPEKAINSGSDSDESDLLSKSVNTGGMGKTSIIENHLDSIKNKQRKTSGNSDSLSLSVSLPPAIRKLSRDSSSEED